MHAEDKANPSARADELPEALRDGFSIKRRLPLGAHGPAWLLDARGANGPAVLKYLTAGSLPGSLFTKTLRQAVSLASTCPTAVPVLEILEDGAGIWLLRQWQAGETLAEALATLGQLTFAQTLALAEGVYRGLLANEQELIVHGHLAPGNVLIQPSGSVSIADHGLRLAGARLAQPLPLPYLAPEQISGGHPSAQGDVYALGALLYTCLCGQYPLDFSGDGRRDDDVLTRHEIRPPPTTQVSGALGHVIWKALQPRPVDRFGTVAELLEAFEGTAGKGGSAQEKGRRGRFRWGRSRS